MTNFARFTIDDDPSTNRGFDAENGATATFALESPTSGVWRVTFSASDVSDVNAPLASLDAPELTLNNGAGSTGTSVNAATPSSEVTTTWPETGAHSYIVRCTVNNGVNSDGSANSDYVFERLCAIRASSGARKIVVTEGTQYSARGWADAQNEFVDYVGPGLPIQEGIAETELYPPFELEVSPQGVVTYADNATSVEFRAGLPVLDDGEVIGYYNRIDAWEGSEGLAASLYLQGGRTKDESGSGGDVHVQGGGSAEIGGSVYVTGADGGDGSGGGVWITGGSGEGSSAHGGTVAIAGGASYTATPGDVTITPGEGEDDASCGQIKLQTYASEVVVSSLILDHRSGHRIAFGEVAEAGTPVAIGSWVGEPTHSQLCTYLASIGLIKIT